MDILHLEKVENRKPRRQFFGGNEWWHCMYTSSRRLWDLYANWIWNFKEFTAQQTMVHTKLSWGSVSGRGSYCSNIELVNWVAWPELYCIVYLGWPIAPSYVSPYAGGGCGVSANEHSCTEGAQINFGDLTPYFTCRHGLRSASGDRTSG